MGQTSIHLPFPIHDPPSFPPFPTGGCGSSAKATAVYSESDKSRFQGLKQAIDATRMCNDFVMLNTLMRNLHVIYSVVYVQ